MANWHLSLERVWRALCRLPLWLLRKLQGGRNPHQQLARTCETLQRQLATSQNREKVWQTYVKALSLARQCDRHELTQVILRFDPLLDEHNSSTSLAVGQALSFLLAANPQTAQNLEAAWRLSPRLNNSASMREVQQQICLQAAQMGDSNPQPRL